jgi:photosystem II stability/assembly factor-like uncharacterized protein
MKTLYITCALLLCVAISPAQQSTWQWINPLPQGNLINGLWTISQDSAVAVADGGTILRTGNGGTTWQVQYNAGGITDPLYAVQFVNGSLGWAVGESGTILRTTDAGGTWSQQTSPVVNNLFAVNFISPTTGWAAGLFGSIVKTTDGGVTWTLQNSNTTETIYGISFRSANLGWAVGSNGTIITTTNGGTTWTSQFSGTIQSLYAVQFLNDNTGIVSGSFGILLRTSNGGMVWSTKTSNTSFSMYSLHFPTATDGYAVGAYGDVIKTSDAGQTWTHLTSATFNDLFCVRFTSQANGYAMGDFGTIMKTTDGGATWNVLSTGVQNTLNSLHFSSTAFGWAVGDEGTIAHSTDGGLSWYLQTSKTLLPLYGVYMINDLIGWAVGDSAMILKTTNGGTTWADQNSHTDITLYSAFFLNTALGWVVGDGGTILHTTTGTSWTAQTTNTGETLLKIQFSDANTGYAVGSNGTILKTVNGGTTWTSLLSNTSATLYSVEIINANTVVASGDFGIIVKTTDGGATWAEQTVDMFTSYYGIDFFNSYGWAVGDDGEIISSLDGGSTWTLQSSGTVNKLWDVQVLPTSTGGAVVFAGGDGGTLLYSAVSPLQQRTWTGAFDSLWTNAANWNPIGLPDKGDSVVIPSTANQPVHRSTVQQINVGAIQINPGARLIVRPGLSQLAVKGTINIDGTLDIDQNSSLEIVAGGNFSTGSAGTFKPGKSTVVFSNLGFVRGTFYNFFINNSAYVISTGNITVTNVMTSFSTLQLGTHDTLRILNPDAQAIQGTGFITSGTILRALRPASTEQYRFESPGTTVKFYPVGTLPDSLAVTTVLSTPPGLPDSLYVRRYYVFNGHGGSNFLYDMTLRYDTTETSIPVDNLALFRDSSGVLENFGATDYTDTVYNLLVLDSLHSFWKWVFGRDSLEPVHPYQFVDTIYAVNNASVSDTVEFGAMPGATNGIDLMLGEVTLGPIPAPSVHDVRFEIPATTGTITDFRDVLTIGHPINTYILRIQPGSGGYPVKLRWNANLFAPGAMMMKDSATHGSVFSVNMKTQDSCTITGASTSVLLIEHSLPTLFPYSKGWNLLSLPVMPFKSRNRLDVFPTAISRAFEYSVGYRSVDSLTVGKGYWIKFAVDQNIAIDGLNTTLDTVSVAAGWNMVGSISYRVPVASILQIPGGIVTSRYFGYKTSYTTSDTIIPGKGYWVKTAGAGKLVLAGSSASALPSIARDLDARNRMNGSITVTDRMGSTQTLSIAPNTEAAQGYELPPLPPEGGFDARFTSNSLAAPMTSATVALTGASYPVTLSWHLDTPAGTTLSVRKSGGVSLGSSDASNGSIRISDPSATVISLSLEQAPHLPTAFALRQNYPNPFNPSTSIRFELPAAASVTIRIYNILGEEVSRLADHRSYEAGSHTISMDGSSLAAGVYFYRMSAQADGGAAFDDTKKMLLIK